jgi:hypothetical protein
VTTQICIQATETDPSTSDLRTFAEHGEGLRAQLEAKVELATELSLAPVHREQARDHLEEFATGQLAVMPRDVVLG